MQRAYLTEIRAYLAEFCETNYIQEKNGDAIMAAGQACNLQARKGWCAAQEMTVMTGMTLARPRNCTHFCEDHNKRHHLCCTGSGTGDWHDPGKALQPHNMRRDYKAHIHSNSRYAGVPATNMHSTQMCLASQSYCNLPQPHYPYVLIQVAAWWPQIMSDQVSLPASHYQSLAQAKLRLLAHHLHALPIGSPGHTSGPVYAESFDDMTGEYLQNRARSRCSVDGATEPG
eukprot:1159298-Pelagomonas_calceolata.AAC.3